MTRFISIISGEKNTGKTTVALNLGMALHKLNQRVLVFDGDFSKPNILEHLNIDYLPITLQDVFDGNQHIFDSIYKHTSGLKIIPSLAMTEYADNVKLKYHLQDLLADYDFVIMDTPNESEQKNNILEISNEALIVHTPEHSSKLVKDSSELIKKYRALNLGVIMNKTSPDSVNSVFNMPVLLKIPEDENIKKSFIMKHPVLHTHPKSSTSKDFLKLGKMIVV